MADKRCVTCKYWRKIRDNDYIDEDGGLWRGPHGECDRLLLEESKKAWIWANDDFDASLITKPDFGCVEHDRD